MTEVIHAGVYRSEVRAVSAQYNSPSPVAWRYGGNQMKRWRTKANVSREELAEAANYSPDTIKSMEQGVRMPTPRVLDVADELCGAQGLLSAAKEYLQRERMSPGTRALPMGFQDSGKDLKTNPANQARTSVEGAQRERVTFCDRLAS